MVVHEAVQGGGTHLAPGLALSSNSIMICLATGCLVGEGAFGVWRQEGMRLDLVCWGLIQCRCQAGGRGGWRGGCAGGGGACMGSGIRMVHR